MNTKSDIAIHTRIIIVDDESAIREMIAITLRERGFEVCEAGDCRQADVEISERRPDLILLDWMLPGMSGVDYARRLRSDTVTEDLPIIMLTARGEEDDKLHGFRAGCDDYVQKPFSVKELEARIWAVLKRVRGFAQDETLQHYDLQLFPSSHRVMVNSIEIKIGPTEFRLLQFFMANAEKVYSRTQLLDRVWGVNVYVEERTVDVHIRRLRKALEPYQCDHYVQTVHGTGYRFSSKVD